MSRRVTKYLRVALPVVGSAILLFSCERTSEVDAAAEELRMTEYSENLSVVNSQNGRRSYHFVTPLVEGYSQAREPYREFRKGVKITTYKDDSLTTVDAVLTANYAIYYEKRKLWETKGDVVVEKSDGKTLYTQQLFWNAQTKKIYSNVDSKIVQRGGTDVFIGEGFESDEEFKDWRFRRMKGRMEVDVTPGEATDSAGGAAAPARPGGSGNAAAQDRRGPRPDKTAASGIRVRKESNAGLRPDKMPAGGVAPEASRSAVPVQRKAAIGSRRAMRDGRTSAADSVMLHLERADRRMLQPADAPESE